MNKIRVVVDSSCLIFLSQIKQLDLLKVLFEEVYIPPSVYKEVVINGEGKTGACEVEEALKSGWLIIKAVNDEMTVNALITVLGKGETEVIVLCKESDFDYALIDEKTARDMAELMEVKTMGVIGVIELAIANGVDIDKKKSVHQLIDMGFRISDRLYKKLFPHSE